MDFSVASFEDRKIADLLVVPFWKDKGGKLQLATDEKKLAQVVSKPLAAGDFKGKEGEVLMVYMEHEPEKRMALLGLGDKEKITTEILRRAYAAITRICLSKKLKNINVIVPALSGLSEENVIRGLGEGLMLANYAFLKHKKETLKENSPVFVQKTVLIGAQKNVLTLTKKLAIICKGVNLARDLTNSNADEITPQYLVEFSQEIGKKLPVKATFFDKKRIEKEKMGLLLAVNRGSHLDPAVIFLEYRGNPKSKDHTVVVGKGITYDTGGLNLKTSGMGMENMRIDMGGAAVALLTLQVAAELKLPINLTAVVPTTENSISATSYKPGDVYTSYTGKTVEIGNTDAEGRLILADVLAYVEKNLKPSRIIDFATLTGGVDIALGNEATGLMSNNDVLGDLLTRAGSETYERVWRLPLFEEYKEGLKSDVGDIKNVATRSASSIMGATFLKSFIGDIPWAHLDIASTAYLSESKRYYPKLATGIGVRLMIEFLEHL